SISSSERRARVPNAAVCPRGQNGDGREVPEALLIAPRLGDRCELAVEPAGSPPELERAWLTWKWRTRLQLQVFARDPVCTICHRAREHGALPSRPRISEPGRKSRRWIYAAGARVVERWLTPGMLRSRPACYS